MSSQYQFKAEMKQLLHLLVHSLYTHPDVFLRELISNSSDALNKVRFQKITDSTILDYDQELNIKIKVDKENNMFSIEDNGIGMDQDDLINNIGTVAKSGTLEFLKTAVQDKKSLDGQLIGQFGVGFYSVFMVTDEVVIETRKSNSDSKAYTWKSNGEESFEISESTKESRGTKITFKLKDEYKDLTEDWKIKDIIKKYSNFVEFPIYLAEEKLNTIGAIWQKPKESISDNDLNEFYKFITHDYQDPLSHLHLNIEGNINFKALIFIPSVAPMNFYSQENQKSLQLYSNKVFIQEDAKDLLPDYMKFIKGVIDTEDLSLNVSREVTQSSPVITKIKNVLVSRVLNHLEDLALNHADKYETFYKNFGPIFKSGVNADFTNKDKIINLLRFESTKSEKGSLISLKQYSERMQEDQKEIYYLSGSSRESLESNPNLEYFKKNNIEVLLLTDPMDVFTIPSIFDFDGKQLKSIDKADLDLKKQEEKSAEAQDLDKKIIDAFKEVLGSEVEDVIESKRLVDSPCTLVVGKQGMDAQMEKMMQMMDKDFKASKRILEINTDHPIIKNLSNIYLQSGSNLKFRNSVLQLFESAMLLEGIIKSPNEYVNRMYAFLEDATKN